MGGLFLGQSVERELQLEENDFGNEYADDAAVDWDQFRFLVSMIDTI